jgi:outer membrane protein TolC
MILIAALAAAEPASAQSTLSLADAIARAKAQNPDAASAAVAEREAAERVVQARAGYFPRIDIAESWQRGNNPAFVFSARLAQRHVTGVDFALPGLNHPAATDLFRTAVFVEQSLFDGTASARVQAASIGREMAATGTRLVQDDLAAAVTDAFGRVLVAEATVRSAAAAAESAGADRELAENRRAAGRVTDADVLQLDVYLALTLERQVQATSDERIARARLNQLMGEPLSATFSLDPTPPVVAIDITSAEPLEEEAVARRPEVALAGQRERVAAVAVAEATSAFLPHVTVQGAWELNGGTWGRRSSSWLAGAAVRINVFNGRADKARLAEARAQAARRSIETRKTEVMVRLDVQMAIARLEAARASEAAGRAAADRARASQRIIRDRYESGLADFSMLLRAAEAVQQADAQQISARASVLTATAALQRAIGRS